VEHLGNHEIVHERLLAKGELPCAAAHGPRADAAAGVDLGNRIPPPRRCDALDGVDNLDVAGAAAEIARQRPGDSLAGGRSLALEQCVGFHHDARRAEAALGGTGDGERLPPQGASLRRQPLDRGHLPAGDAGCRLGARHDRPPVDDHGAGAAEALGAHPSFIDRNPQRSRSTSRRLSPGSASTEICLPFSTSCIVLTSSISAAAATHPGGRDHLRVGSEDQAAHDVGRIVGRTRARHGFGERRVDRDHVRLQARLQRADGAGQAEHLRTADGPQAHQPSGSRRGRDSPPSAWRAC